MIAQSLDDLASSMCKQVNHLSLVDEENDEDN
eukprot:CAMPEP_0198221384 /NCGR_PEP_ID=MMETSP1445-20131203/83495_1 /TAXON_ID=36898 /ORGANISM="Pyramimonas sp., Strain CCMP2087" /LENGTH=31 /DNA_ID= /DNA_START= /DNA_END= /DNA_ORIENTATION=